MGLRGWRSGLALYLLLVVCWCSEQSDQDANWLARTQMHDALQGFHQSSHLTARTLEESGIEARMEETARARHLMEETEREDDQIQEQAERYHRASSQTVSLERHAEKSPQQKSPQQSPEAERIKRAMQQFRSHPRTESSEHSDLGEGAAVEMAATNANAMTAQAQLKAKQMAAQAARQEKIFSAKQIAAKVRNLVAVQRRLENEANVPHHGMVEMKESVDATHKITESAKSQMQDSLMAQQMEAKAARSTFKHLIEHEREEQRQALQAERQKGAAMLTEVKKTLQVKEEQVVAEMKAAAQKVETKLEATLAKTKVAKAIEDAVKHKLSKRVEELTSAGKQVVGGVADSVESLKRRVRRLRRSQDRIRSEQSTIQRTFTSQKAAEQTYLGESPQTKQFEHELDSIRTVLQQQQQQQQSIPQQPETPTTTTLENKLLKEKLRAAELANQLLVKSEVHHQPEPPSHPESTMKYTTSKMHRYFSKRRQQAKLALQQQVKDEEQNLKMMKQNLEDMAVQGSQGGAAKSQLQADVFLQVPDDEARESRTLSIPSYQQHKEQADNDLRQLLSLMGNN